MTLVIILAAVVGLLIAAVIFRYVCAGAIILLVAAADQGFVGIAVYATCWVFLFPIMVIASLIVAIAQTT